MNSEIANSVAKNTTVQLGQQIITWASSFVLMLFLPRYLGPINYGRIFLAMSIAGIFLMLIDFDGRFGIAKRFARSPAEAPQILVNSLGFRVMFWGIAMIGMIIFSFIAEYPHIIKILFFIFGVEMLWLGGRTVLMGLFLGFEAAKYSSIGAIAERMLVSVVGITALLLGVGPVGIAIIMVSGTLLNFLILARFAKRFIPVLPKVDWKGSLLLIKEGIPYLFWAIFGAIYYRVDGVMLSLMTPETVLGWYGASYKFFDVLAFVPSIYSISILPALSRMWGKEDQMLARTTQKSLEFIIIAGIPISISVVAFSRPIIALFFGLEGYGPSVLILQVFSSGLLLIYIDMVLGTALIACDKQGQWAVVAFFAIFVNVSLNYFMIPYFQTHYGNGGIGTSIATIITEFFVMICALAIMPQDIFNVSITPIALKAFSAACIMGFSLWLLAHGQFNWILETIVGVLIYLVALFALKTFNPRELEFMKNFLSFQNLKAALSVKKGTNA